MNKDEIKQHLEGFIGTENYYRHPMMRNLYATDGAQFVFETCGKEVDGKNKSAFWLFDVIMSYQTNRKVASESFQVWTLTKRDNDWLIKCTDGDKGYGEVVLCKQVVPFSGFILDEITLWAERGSIDGVNTALVIMLPSER